MDVLVDIDNLELLAQDEYNDAVVKYETLHLELLTLQNSLESAKDLVLLAKGATNLIAYMRKNSGAK